MPCQFTVKNAADSEIPARDQTRFRRRKHPPVREQRLEAFPSWNILGRRKRESRTTSEKAKARAEAIATSINNGQIAALTLTGADRDSYIHAQQLLAPLGIPLHAAVEELVKTRDHRATLPPRGRQGFSAPEPAPTQNGRPSETCGIVPRSKSERRSKHTVSRAAQMRLETFDDGIFQTGREHHHRRTRRMAAEPQGRAPHTQQYPDERQHLFRLLPPQRLPAKRPPDGSRRHLTIQGARPAHHGAYAGADEGTFESSDPVIWRPMSLAVVCAFNIRRVAHDAELRPTCVSRSPCRASVRRGSSTRFPFSASVKEDRGGSRSSGSRHAGRLWCKGRKAIGTDRSGAGEP